MTTIKHNAGNEVFWLSSKGFTKGVIKSVAFSEEMFSDKKVKISLRYFLKNATHYDAYCGDEVTEDKIFLSYQDMIDHYSKQEL